MIRRLMDCHSVITGTVLPSREHIIGPAAPVEKLSLGLEQEAGQAGMSTAQQNAVENTLMCLALAAGTRQSDSSVSGGPYC